MTIRVAAPTIACQDMLRRIFSSEKVEYTTGIGPHGMVIFYVSDRGVDVIRQWRQAMQAVSILDD